MHSILSYLNLLAASASALGGIVGLAKPCTMSGSSQVTPGELFYARMYAVRALPFGIVAGLLPFWYQGPAVASVLFTAALIQAADVVIGVGKRDFGMVTGASIGMGLHLVSAYTIIGEI